MTADNIGNLFKQNGIDFRRFDAENRSSEVDTATSVAAKFFNDLPLRVSFAKAAHIESEANLAQRLEGAENFTNAAIVRGQLGPNRSEDEENDDSASMAIVRSAIDILTRRREREREEWSRTTSTVGGVTMTGGEWAALSQLMRSDSEFRQKLLDAFMARGMTFDEAEERYDRVADVAEIAAIPPAQRTDAQNETIRTANADPAFRRDVEQARNADRVDAGITADDDHEHSLGVAFERATNSEAPSSQQTAMRPEPRVTQLSGPAI